MNNRCPSKQRVQLRICLLFLTATLCASISIATGDAVNVIEASGVISQQRLELGKAVKREIAEGETHSYRIRLAAGEFIHVFIYQRGVNVAATLVAPDGKKLLEADSPRSSQEAEWITHVAATAGEYSIEVRTVDKGAPAGRYEIKIEERRKSAPGDETRLSAQRAFTDGTRLFGEKNYRGAIEKYQDALAQYRKSARRVEEAATLNCIGRSNASLSDYQAAIERYKEALSIYDALSDVQGRGITEQELGNAYLTISRYGDAISYYERALEARRKVSYRAGEGSTLNNLGNAYSALGRNEKAIEYYEQSLAISQEMKDRVGEGRTLNNLGRAYASLGRYEKAALYYEQALVNKREVKDRAGEGSMLYNLGIIYYSLRRYEKAIESNEQSLTINREMKNRAGEGSTLNNLGLAYYSLSRYEKAIECYEQSLAISRETKDRRVEGIALINLGHAYSLLSRYEKAIEYYEQSLALSREMKDRVVEGDTLNGLGVAYVSLSRYEKAIEYYERSLAISREMKNRAGERNAFINLGGVYSDLGRYEKAIEYYGLSLALSREMKDREGEGNALNSLGGAYSLLNLYEKAIEYYEQSLAIIRGVKNRAGEGIVLQNLGLAYNNLSRYEKAIEYLEQSLMISREVKDRANEGRSLGELGSLYQSLRRYEKAIEYYEQSLAIIREVKNRTNEGRLMMGFGVAYRDLNRYEQAIEYFNQSLAISREVKDRRGEGNTLNNLMIVWERQNNNPVAIFYGKQAVNAYQEIRGNIRSLDRESQHSYLKDKETAYRKLADLLISQGRLAEAEKVLELLKEEEFNRVIRRNGPSDPKIGLTKTETEAAKVTDQLASLASERGPLLAKISNKSATDQERQRLDQIEAAIFEANKKIKLVLAEIRKAYPNDEVMTQQSQSMMQSLRKLGPGSVALYTVVTNEKGWVILTTPDFRRAYPINTTDLNKTISDFRTTLKSDRYDPVPLAQKLYDAIFLQKNDDGATLAGDLKSYGARTLMWSLDGVLRYVPISALHDGKGYLVERYPDLVFTTASLTRLLDAAQGNWRAFGLGVSKEHKDFPALTAVPREMHSIIREAGLAQSRGVLPGVIRLDEQFTRKAMIDGLHEGYPVVHIASHFRFNPEREETSFLLLGDGSYLSLEEMQNSPGIFESVELLTLSACDTATTGANGKEVEGLAFVAQDLGAKAVVASLWPVADVGTEVLMREFYRLKKENPRWSKAEALRQAQTALLKGKVASSRAMEEKRGPKVSEAEGAMKPYKRDAKAPFAHPHYWAPFILIGNWK